MRIGEAKGFQIAISNYDLTVEKFQETEKDFSKSARSAVKTMCASKRVPNLFIFTDNHKKFGHLRASPEKFCRIYPISTMATFDVR
mmetsp:Transcript_4487/g.6724  ORF Transcript_4487/g.6724 Transcript_4487/m.6724 type:complete len:86 (+) Transcript_4487:365-622(+)